MRKTTAGLLIGAGAGLILGWLFRNRFRAMFDAPAEIVVDSGVTGPFVSHVTEEVTVEKSKHVRWQITNNTGADVLIELKDWSAPPAVSPDPDDHEQPPQRGLSRKVPGRNHGGHPGRRPLRGKARGPQGGAKEEKVKYAVHLNDSLAVDPIVKLIL